ncbi:MFS transporter [Corynebacterium freiburgense]|uniref:MFS transporter n=1 Tax=Corynebacterium freiburgense TaxID=556548 RepID=UPI0005554547|nr:MFS transporter [Corynebacterium freiburgense]WJZ03921.1 multidrug efflux system protein MdtL [Corynebacterium freiburgense]
MMPVWLRVALGLFAIAFGANIFAPLLPVYQRLDGLSATQVTWIFAIYVGGLVPALLIGGPLSDRKGRRALIRPALVCSAIGSIVIIAGGVGPNWLLSLGRFIAGAGVGFVMAAGAAWLKQVSTDSAQAGARRATIALSAGFGGGPLVGGLIAEWIPNPDIWPFLFHLTLLVLVIPLVWNAPSPPVITTADRKFFPKTAFSPRFIWTVAAWAPWVFGTATISFATLTSLVASTTPAPIAYTGAIGAVTMLTGVAIQPLATRLGNGYVPPAIVGLSTATIGLLLGAGVAATLNPWLLIPTAIFLGASYGTMMVSGLREVEQIAPPNELGALIAVFYSLTYVGFFAPFALSILGPWLGYSTCLIFGACVTAASIVPVARVVRKAVE